LAGQQCIHASNPQVCQSFFGKRRRGKGQYFYVGISSFLTIVDPVGLAILIVKENGQTESC
jgi:hypothetical protein